MDNDRMDLITKWSVRVNLAKQEEKFIKQILLWVQVGNIGFSRKNMSVSSGSHF